MAKAVTERTTPQRRADGVKAARTMRAKYGKNYFERIGKKGGSRTNTKPKGFEANPALARIAGRKGGKK